MLPTRIFSESPFKGLKILGAILVPIFLFFAFIIISDETPEITSNGLNKSAELLIIIVGGFFATMLLTFFILSFQHRRTLKCDFEGCEIKKSNYWGAVSFTDQFKWSDLTDTNIVERDIDVGEGGIMASYSFSVETNSSVIDLLELKTSSKKNIKGVIDYVNQAAQHLEYVWIKNAEVGSRLAVDSIYGYSKVGRS